MKKIIVQDQSIFSYFNTMRSMAFIAWKRLSETTSNNYHRTWGTGPNL